MKVSLEDRFKGKRKPKVPHLRKCPRDDKKISSRGVQKML